MHYLLRVLESIEEQTYPFIEIVISDDCSRDDTRLLIPEFLKKSRFPWKFLRQETNLGYDANLRAALAAGSGDYLFILGNDDALADSHVIEVLAEEIALATFPAVVITNYRDFADSVGTPIRRSGATRVLSGDVSSAVTVFSSFSFVAGIVFKKSAFLAHNTAAFDGSVFVQAYLGTRIIACGGRALMLDRVAVAKDVRIGESTANSYKDVLRAQRPKIGPHSQGLAEMLWVATSAIEDQVSKADREKAIRKMTGRILSRTLPFWLLEHRKERFHVAAINMALGCFPPILLRRLKPSKTTILRMLPRYLLFAGAGLFAPLAVLEKGKRAILARKR